MEYDKKIMGFPCIETEGGWFAFENDGEEINEIALSERELRKYLQEA